MDTSLEPSPQVLRNANTDANTSLMSSIDHSRYKRKHQDDGTNSVNTTPGKKARGCMKSRSSTKFWRIVLNWWWLRMVPFMGNLILIRYEDATTKLAWIQGRASNILYVYFRSATWKGNG